MLLIHGTGDDNVHFQVTFWLTYVENLNYIVCKRFFFLKKPHFQHSAILAKVLRSSNLDLEFEVYPDSQHTPSTEIQHTLYQKMTKFLLTCYNINYHSYYEQLSYHHLRPDVLPDEYNTKE